MQNTNEVPVKVGMGLVDQELKPPITGYYTTEVYYTQAELIVPQGIYLDRIQDADKCTLMDDLLERLEYFRPMVITNRIGF